jgi:hypothetical protein
MIYILKRASEYNEKSPCEEATLRMFKHKNTLLNEESDEYKWSIEINTFEELNQFIEKYGDLVIYKDYGGYNAPCIKIYDTYIE